MARKPRSDAKLLNLPKEKFEQLKGWLREHSYDQVLELVAAEWDISTSVGALSNFYSQFCWQDRYSEQKALAEAFNPSTENFDPVIVQAVKAKIFELVRSKDPESDAIAQLFRVLDGSAKLEIKQRELALQERKVVMMERKAALVDEAKQVNSDQALSDEEKLKRYRQIFGGS